MAEAAPSSGKRNAEDMETESGGIDPTTKRPCFPEVTTQKLVSGKRTFAERSLARRDLD